MIQKTDDVALPIGRRKYTYVMRRVGRDPNNHKIWTRKWREKNPGKVHDARLKCAHGITTEDYQTMFAAQGGECAICKTRSPGGPGNRLHVDHDHPSGKIRGLLCSRCNVGIGQLCHDVNTLKSAIAYLKGSAHE